MQARKVRVADIERLRRTMQNVPEHQVEEVTTAEAVRMLSPEIHAMQAKGYGLSAIAAHLSDNGLAVTTKTLKTYLGEARAAGGRKKRRKTKAHRPATGAGGDGSDDGIEARRGGQWRLGRCRAASTSRSPRRLPRRRRRRLLRRRPRTQKGTTGTTRPGDEAAMRRSAFVPKEDTRDI